MGIMAVAVGIRDIVRKHGVPKGAGGRKPIILRQDPRTSCSQAVLTQNNKAKRKEDDY